MAYSISISSLGLLGNMQPNPNGNDSLTGSYTTTRAYQSVSFQIYARFNSKNLLPPDIYTDTVTVNIVY